MVSGKTNLAEGLLRAIKAERDGHGFYTMAANSSRDPKAQTVFAQLAAEEGRPAGGQESDRWRPGFIGRACSQTRHRPTRRSGRCQ